MKRLLLFIILIAGVLSSFAQQVQEVVYLKNGSIVRGIIIEQVPNESLKIQTADGSIFAYKMADVQKITKEANTGSKRSYNFNNAYDSNGLQNGYKGMVDFGYTVGTGVFGEDRIELSTSHGYQFNPYLFTGIGFGAHYYLDSEVVEIPIYFHTRATFLKGRISPFADFKIGYSVYDATGLYMHPAIGCRFALGSKIWRKREFRIYHAKS